MPIVAYKKYRPTPDVAKVIQQAIGILTPEVADGYTLTLRQLYYKFVSAGLIANEVSEYKRLGRILTDARVGGLIDWDWIEDRGRGCYFHSFNSDYEKAIEGLQYGVGIDYWKDQGVYLETWIEKQALESVVARPCRRLRVPYMACKGYLSASESYRAGLRFEEAISLGLRPVLLHLGDHDPSGIDMTRDNGTRLELFARRGVEVRRLALNMDQVEEYKPPENPAKEKDSRFAGYKALHGDKSWELDALSNRVIDGIITSAVKTYIDTEKWEKSLAEERELRRPLALIEKRHKEVLQLATSAEANPLDRLARIDLALGSEELASTLGLSADRLTLEAPHGSESTLAMVGEAVMALGSGGSTLAEYSEEQREGFLRAITQVGDAVNATPNATATELATDLSRRLGEVREELVDLTTREAFDTTSVDVANGDNDEYVEEFEEEEQEEAYGAWSGADGLEGSDED